MSTVDLTEYEQVLKVVQAWPASQRLILAQALLGSLASALAEHAQPLTPWLKLQRSLASARLEQTLSSARTQESRETVASEAVQRSHHQALEQALGLINLGQEPPSDEIIARWLNERREERYGL